MKTFSSKICPSCGGPMKWVAGGAFEEMEVCDGCDESPSYCECKPEKKENEKNVKRN